MSAQDPIHADIDFNGETWTVAGYNRDKEVINNILLKAKFPYQWGVYLVTLLLMLGKLCRRV